MKRIMIGTILIIAIGMMACGNTNKNTQETLFPIARSSCDARYPRGSCYLRL